MAVNNIGQIVDGTQEHLSTDIEESFSYIRSDGLKICFTVMYVDDTGPAYGQLSSWTPTGMNQIGEPEQCLEMNREEMRYLRAFLNRPEVSRMLDEPLDVSEDTHVPATMKPTVWA